jgi:DNA-directed RNA polymerase specialized sigma24 family protein
VLVERIAAGDKLAMQALFARHRTNIYRWLFRFVGNQTVAEDLLSDVFFDVWQQAARFEGRSAVTTWLLSMARFKALSARRRRTDAPLAHPTRKFSGSVAAAWVEYRWSDGSRPADLARDSKTRCVGLSFPFHGIPFWCNGCQLELAWSAQ